MTVEKITQYPPEGLYMKLKVTRKMARELGQFLIEKYPQQQIGSFLRSYGIENTKRHMYLKINETWNKE